MADHDTNDIRWCIFYQRNRKTELLSIINVVNVNIEVSFVSTGSNVQC